MNPHPLLRLSATLCLLIPFGLALAGEGVPGPAGPAPTGDAVESATLPVEGEATSLPAEDDFEAVLARLDATTNPATRPAGEPSSQAAPPLPEADMIAVLKVYARGDYAAVVAMLRDDYQQGSSRVQQRLLLARAYVHLTQADDALAVVKSVLDIDKENPEANRLTGQILHDSGKDADALPYLEKAFRLKRDAATAGVLGDTLYKLAEPSKAKPYLKLAAEQDIRNPANCLLLGKIYLDRGSGALAEKYLLLAQEAGLNTAELHVLLGNAYMAQQKFVGPIQIRRLTKPAQPGQIVEGEVVLEKVPGNPEQYKVANRYCALYEGRLIIDSLAKDSAPAWFMVARGWFAVGQYDLAKEALAKSAKDAGPEGVKLTARLAIATKDFDGLSKLVADPANKAVFDAKAVADLYYRAALAQRADGKRDQAVALLKQAEEQVPTAENVLRALAGLYQAAEQPKDALRYYARLVELFPDAPDIDELRNAVKVLQEKTGAAQDKKGEQS